MMFFFTFEIAEMQYVVIEASTVDSAVEELYCISNIDYDVLHTLSYECNTAPQIRGESLKQYIRNRQLNTVNNITTIIAPEVQVYYIDGQVEYYN